MAYRDRPEGPMTESQDIVGFTPDDEKTVAEVVTALAVIESYSDKLLSPQNFRKAASALVSDYMVQVLSGELPGPKNAKEAVDIMGKVMDLVVKGDLASLGSDLQKIDDPEERAAVFAEIKKKAQEAKEAQGKK